MNAHSKIEEAATVFDPILADAWRHSALKVEETLRAIRQHLKTLDEADEEIIPGVPRHRPAYVESCRKILPWHLSVYLGALRTVSESEERMRLIGMPFAESSDACAGDVAIMQAGAAIKRLRKLVEQRGR